MTILKKIQHWLKPKNITLSVFIDTDDDAKVIFEGKSYCFYAKDLNFVRKFRTVQEAYECLRADILIVPGGKVSDVLGQWIEEFITAHKNGEYWPGIHGNQTVEISIDQ